MAMNTQAQAQFQKLLMTAMGLPVAVNPKKTPKVNPKTAAPPAAPPAPPAAPPAAPVVVGNQNPHGLGLITTVLTNPFVEFLFLILGTCCANHFFPGNELAVSSVSLVFTMYCYNVYEVMVWLAKCLKHWMIFGAIIHTVAFFYQGRHKDPWL